MSQMKIRIQDVNSTNQRLGTNRVKLSSTIGGIRSVMGSVDGRIRARRQIGSRLNDAEMKLKKLEQQIKALELFTTRSMASYTNAESRVQRLGNKYVLASKSARFSNWQQFNHLRTKFNTTKSMNLEKARGMLDLYKSKLGQIFNVLRSGYIKALFHRTLDFVIKNRVFRVIRATKPVTTQPYIPAGYNALSNQYLEKNYCTIEEAVVSNDQNWFQRLLSNTKDNTVKSINSFKEIGVGMWDAHVERSNKMFDSWGDFGNAMTFGIPKGIYEGLDHNYQQMKADPSFRSISNYITLGATDMIIGAVNPKDPYSAEHWLNSMGLASFVVGGGAYAKSIKQTIPQSKIDTSAPKVNNSTIKSKEVQMTDFDRTRLEQWKYSPSEDLYLKNKSVYDNPKYYNQQTGEINWPGTKGDPNIDGFRNGEYTIETLKPGQQIDRFGSNDSGQYFSPAGSSYESRALPPHMKDQPYTKYVIEREFEVRSGEVAPWFDEAGGGTQYYTKINIVDDFGNAVEPTVGNLLKYGYIKIIE